MTLNRPTPEGRELGEQLARFCDAEVEKKRGEDAEWPERCRTCAFRLGTIPNGCPTTQMDALKCVLEKVPFLCHEKPVEWAPIVDGTPCAGWLSMVDLDGPKHEAFWPFSDGIEAVP